MRKSSLKRFFFVGDTELSILKYFSKLFIFLNLYFSQTRLPKSNYDFFSWNFFVEFKHDF